MYRLALLVVAPCLAQPGPVAQPDAQHGRRLEDGVSCIGARTFIDDVPGESFKLELRPSATIVARGNPSPWKMRNELVRLFDLENTNLGSKLLRVCVANAPISRTETFEVFATYFPTSADELLNPLSKLSEMGKEAIERKLGDDFRLLGASGEVPAKLLFSCDSCENSVPILVDTKSPVLSRGERLGQ
jgi:hypothetical protein